MASSQPRLIDTAAVLREAMGAAQSGDLARAAQLAHAALREDGDPVALNAFLGMVSARARDLAGAAQHLAAAHRLKPTDVTITCNLIAVLMDDGDREGALAVASRERSMEDGSLRIARLRGFLAQSLDRFGEAAEAYEHVLSHVPDDFETLNNLGNARSAIGDTDGSIAALEQAITLDPGAAPSRLNLAAVLRSGDRLADAERVLRAAARDFPADSRPLHDLYVQFKKAMRNEDALATIEEAVAREPSSANLQLKLAIEYGIVRRPADSERAYRCAIAAEPGLVEAYLGLGIQYEHTNREDEFAPLIALAESNGVQSGALGLLRALEHRRAKRFEQALESLASVPAEVEPERTAHLRATLLDRLGRTDEAFSWFTETARRHSASPSDPLHHAALLRDELRTEIAMMTPQRLASWPHAAPSRHRPDPVFLVGFPRSGTTLLDTILMGHPGTAVMEEQPPLNLVDQALGGLAAIPSLDETGIAAARARYFEEVGKIQEIAQTSLLIDKSPLFLTKVPLIQRLFPDARFILALRHPCDVLLSCFMTNFRLNPAMANFLRLEDAAEFYDLTFRHWERARALFPINVHTVVYESLVENVAAEVRPLCDFLGLEWHEDALDHRTTARARGLITTASYSQVTEPIYQRAAGRWQRYRQHLEPILPTLVPWVEKFGYAL